MNMRFPRIHTITLAGLVLGVILDAAAPVTDPASLVFDVASVKPAKPDQRGGIIRQMPGNQRYIANNVPLRLIMTVAYSVTDRQISGGPSWIGTEPFDIDAKTVKSMSSDDLHTMLAHLIEERFQLKIRHEQREQPVYELVVDKGGSRLKEHDAADLDHPPMGGTAAGLEGTNVTMNYFAFVLSRNLDRNVIDKTGLAAHYDLKLEFARDLPPGVERAGGGAPVSDGPTIFTALKEQLGLRLVPAKGPVDFLVIEGAEKPSDN
jgi:uncharacterized protein (TIGR03435 family)